MERICSSILNNYIYESNFCEQRVFQESASSSFFIRCRTKIPDLESKLMTQKFHYEEVVKDCEDTHLKLKHVTCELIEVKAELVKPVKK